MLDLLLLFVLKLVFLCLKCKSVKLSFRYTVCILSLRPMCKSVTHVFKFLLCTKFTVLLRDFQYRVGTNF